MKLTVTAKEPELSSQMMDELYARFGCNRLTLDNLHPAEREKFEIEEDKIIAVIKKYFRWGEYIDIDVDTDTCSCSIIVNK